MATRSTGGVTLELQKASYLNFNKQIEKLQKNADGGAFKAMVKFLFQIKLLAQQKLKSDQHIVTSRLRNSIYVQTPNQKYANVSGNKENYSDDNGKSFESDLGAIGLKDNEGAVGTNVEYAGKIEFENDSFLYWAMKNADPDKMGREIAKELLNGIK